MKTKELRSKDIADLEAELKSLLQEQFNLRMQKGLGEAPKANSCKNARRDVARIKTILNEKKREAHGRTK
jgi:large subunit ribosomal protein L29